MSEYRMMALTEEEAAAFKEMLADYAETKQQREKEKKNDGWTKEKILAVNERDAAVKETARQNAIVDGNKELIDQQKKEKRQKNGLVCFDFIDDRQK